VKLREIGTTGIQVTPIAMGCWPIAGVTTLGVTPEDARNTLLAAYDSGINFYDTAYVYGYEGESEKRIAEALGDKREQIVIASKGGVHWQDKQQRVDASPEKLKAELEESLLRLKTDYIDLHYLHCSDPNTPVEVSAQALAEAKAEGKIRAVGASNLSLEELRRFHEVCPISAYQAKYNMLQRDIEKEIVPWCLEHNISIMPYWPLLKGLLAGKIRKDSDLDPEDSRRKYPFFQPDAWEKNNELLDELEATAKQEGKTIAQVVLNWTMNQPGICSVLCGARRTEQIQEDAEAMDWGIIEEISRKIDEAIQQYGTF